MNGKSGEMFRLTAFVLLELALLILVCDVNAKSVYLGSGGERVAAIQRKMKQSGAYDGKIDGICGFETMRCFEKLFPGSRAVSDHAAAQKLGLCGSVCFSSAAEITARYIEFRQDHSALTAVAPSRLLREDAEFLKCIFGIKPSSAALDKAIKDNRTRKLSAAREAY